jgi:hypothetical protein
VVHVAVAALLLLGSACLAVVLGARGESGRAHLSAGGGQVVARLVAR